MPDSVLVGLSGSLRRGATNRKLMREAARLFGPARFTEADLNLPLYNGDDEEAHGIPAPVQDLADLIAGADAVVISTPEYNKGPSGVLKNALDWISRTKGNPWAGKPVAVMSATAGRAGGERAQMILRGFMVPFQPRLTIGPEMHLADSSNQFDEDGRLTSPLYTKTLTTLMENLRAEIAR
ncbi:chromate reductase [Cribrihabitans marinus]|uniref:Chromate reductase n=1 Tax=Cribrihabitans marinus TaxID=1227549 RepID=A0A1H7C4C4_9RHOB|nr:NADPH-dependent FMN reductase [Cribrihabitans marinus]GGH33767.1 NAD(P)H-dependent FMN reductase [Cribrihabitans marinus]SEJ80485.1 chromate reductase [Cribrihabitans marinus]